MVWKEDETNMKLTVLGTKLIHYGSLDIDTIQFDVRKYLKMTKI